MPREYTFHDIGRCNLCHAPGSEAKVLGRRLSVSQGARPTRRAGISTTVMRCQRCGLVYSNPLPIPGNIAQHYDTPPDSYWKPEYFAADPDYFAGPIATFRTLWDNGRQPVALDIGAGIGKAMRALDDAGFQAHGLEPSAAFRATAIERGGINPDRLTLGTIEDSPYAADTFDFVTFGAVLEHLQDPAATLERALGWLRPGGLIHAEVPSSDWLTSRLVNLAYRAQGLDYVTNLSPMHPPYHLYEFTPRSFELHAARNGHSIALARLLPGVDTFLPGPDRAWRALMARTGTGMQLEVWLRQISS